MSKKFLSWIGLLAVLTLTLSACGTPKAPSWHGLSATADTAYLAAGSYIYAVKVADRSLVWRYPVEKADPNFQYYAAPVLTADGQLLIGSEGKNHFLISLKPDKVAAYYAALQADTEMKAPEKATYLATLTNWTFSGAKDKWIGSPLATADAIYAPNADHSLYMLDLQGNKLRSFTAGAAMWGQPVTDGKLIYVTSLDHFLYALDPQSALVDGVWQAKWSVDLGAASPGPAALGPDGLLYVGSFDSEVVVIDPKAQAPAIVRTFPAEGWVWNPPAFSGDQLYFGDMLRNQDGNLTGKLYGFDQAGDSLWPALQPNSAILSTPLIFDDQVIFTTETGELIAVKDGQIVWTKTPGGKLYGPAVAAGKYLLVAPHQGEFLLVAYDGNGLQAWTFKPEN